MLTSPAVASRVLDDRPAFRAFRASVAAVQQLSPAFLRITFTGDDLDGFGTAGLDQRVKVILPLPDTGYDAFPGGEDWYVAWRALPERLRNPIRTYTIRAVRQELGEVDIDFALHGDGGPASRWARHARVGDPMVLVGPDDLSTGRALGIDWRPGDVDTVLLAGDETAAPAICAILEALPRDARGHALIEVPSPDDVLAVDAPAGVDLRWLPRAAGAVHGSRLVPSVRDAAARIMISRAGHAEVADVDVDRELLWDVPEGRSLDGGIYAWLAGEASAIKSLRRYLVGEAGLDRRRVAFMGYWRLGRAELG
ncbi:siderophore-interacting protein [Agromyces rhizosphaerae]|uniref:Siderophore-interacting protein n=1 Tax=Agromyces rhizosphaerae TaxID=88374 RepID=A0A9W6FQF4_9MICO|nr:siderophore-interacting protein [Agromyces rhizosphaerae]GLI26013.1 siderophore-interacting protein [Agromyces rhizosphaerae]